MYFVVMDTQNNKRVVTKVGDEYYFLDKQNNFSLNNRLFNNSIKAVFFLKNGNVEETNFPAVTTLYFLKDLFSNNLI